MVTVLVLGAERLSASSDDRALTISLGTAIVISLVTAIVVSVALASGRCDRRQRMTSAPARSRIRTVPGHSGPCTDIPGPGTATAPTPTRARRSSPLLPAARSRSIRRCLAASTELAGRESAAGGRTVHGQHLCGSLPRGAAWPPPARSKLRIPDGGQPAEQRHGTGTTVDRAQAGRRRFRGARHVGGVRGRPHGPARDGYSQAATPPCQIGVASGPGTRPDHSHVMRADGRLVAAGSRSKPRLAQRR
jgi:hypothetical protein